MKFIVKCETFARLSTICQFFEPSIEHEIKDQLNVLRLENFNGKSYAIATNQKIAAVEYLGPTNEPNGCAHVILDSVMIEKAKEESAYGSFFEVSTIPEIAAGAVKSMLGWAYPGNPCRWFDKTAMNDWRKWVNEKPVKTKGAMYWDLSHLQTLLQSSPSGKIIFPEMIDVDYPILIRDRMNDNWFGLFVAKPTEADAALNPVKAATLPIWW